MYRWQNRQYYPKNEIIYTDAQIKDIPDIVNADLLPRVRVGDIITIEKVKGKCLT